nr:GAF domain-containing protein [Cellvibrionaceae bacterium]
MLNSLRRIVQEVNAASDLGSVLELIVDRVQEAMNTEVCSIYLRDTHMRYVLMATVGLNKRAINHVSLGLNQGLVGLVAVREEPLNLEDAESHPNYRYFPETGEECYCAFLGVPITHHRKVLGVLVVQQRQKRRFDEGEEAFLVTMSAQLAAVIAHAEATGTLRNVGQKSQARFTGVAGASGVALGTCVVVSPVADLNAVPYQECESIDSELAFFAECIAAVKQDIQKLGTELEDKLNKEERVLFEAYVGMLDDRSLGGEVCAKIQAGLTAKYSWSEVIREHVKNFSRMNDPYLRERASDVRDLGSRVLGYLQQTERLTPSYPDKTILAGEELTASVLAEVPNGKLAGIVAKSGSSNSHIAILARSLGIPTVMGAVDLPFTRLEGRPLIVDGYRGAVYSDPNDDLIAQYQTIIDEDKRLIAGLDSLKDLACTTLDNHRVALWVNTGLM